jgi:glyoxylase-like metal-dependent hydrolase (beta-lactamase superfamily II)
VSPGDLPAGVLLVRANNPSPLTLDGTNAWIASDWVVDPGPDDGEHLERVLAAAGGGIAGIVLTHGHPDHAAGAPALAQRAGGVPVLRPGEGDGGGPFEVVATPGHSPDSVCLLLDRVVFTGDTVLGTGSVFLGPAGEGRPSSLAAYLDSLRRLRERPLEWLLPGHGPPVRDPAAKLDEYLEHRLDRERRLLAALEDGARTEGELLDRAWSDAPAALRPAAAITLAAHLEKLAREGRLPPDLAGRW